jgi:hypothetical protein
MIHKRKKDKAYKNIIEKLGKKEKAYKNIIEKLGRGLL